MATTQALEKELIGLEKRYWQAIKDEDVETAMRLTDDTCIVAGAQGVAAFDRDAFEKMMKAADYTLESFELRDPKVQVIGDDVAVVAYQVHEELTVDGKHVSLDAAETSAWVRRDGHWLCALHTESIAGDPFGRDRQSKKSNGKE